VHLASYYSHCEPTYVIPCCSQNSKTSELWQCATLISQCTTLISRDVSHQQCGYQASFYTTITMDALTLLVIFAFLSCAIILLAQRLMSIQKAIRLPLPPGPKTTWLGGSQLPQTYHWLTYARWKDTFGLLCLILPSNVNSQSYMYYRRHHIYIYIRKPNHRTEYRGSC
jgi:hypothetical protein